MEQLNATSQTIEFRTTNPFARFLSLFLFFLFIILGFIIAIPILIIAAVLGLVFFLYLKIKNTLTRAHKPNGPLDGRHNVKVINPDE
jgi:hypothetical protein